MYEVIVLGATFAAAGIAAQYGKRCLVLERRGQAGYEFFGALHFEEDETAIYSHFKKCHTLFSTEIVSIEEKDGAFHCVCHGIDGFQTYTAKRVVDTRCSAKMSQSKTYNLLIVSDEEPHLQDATREKAKGENRWLLFCPVPLACSYPEARSIASRVIRGFSQNQRLILSANEFDYQVKGEYPKVEKGITYLPSKAYENPRAAFDAGNGWKEGV